MMATNVSAPPLAPADLIDSFSDDEESFVVLGKSLPPVMCNDENSLILNQIGDDTLIDGSAVEEALNLVQSHISSLSGSTNSFPKMPETYNQDLVSAVDKLHLSTVTVNSVDLGPDEIQQKVDLLVEENIKLKETLYQNNLAMKQQYETLVVWQEDVMKVHQSHKEKFAETKKYIESLKIENVRLAQALALAQSKSSNAENVGVKETQVSNDSLIYNLAAHEDAMKQIALLEAEIKMLQSEKESYKLEEVAKFQTQLDKAKQIHVQEVAEYTKQQIQADSLQKILLDEIKMLKTKSADHLKCVKQETLDKVQEQLMAAQMHITNLEHKQNEDRDTITEKDTIISTLKAETAKGKKMLQEGEDRMNAIIELYKNDFEAEHRQRKEIQASKEQIANDLLDLQRRNNSLLEEVRRLSDGSLVHVERFEQPEIAATTAASAPPPISDWTCPKCNFKFADYQTLENHVYRCIEIDSLF